MSAERRGAAENKQSFNIRQKMGGMQFDGMAPDNEPQDLPENRPRLAINVRYDGGISARPGFTQLFDFSGPITGMHDHQVGAEIGLFAVFTYREETDPTLNGNTLGIYCEELDPDYSTFVDYVDDYWGPPGSSHWLPFAFGVYGDNLLYGPAVGIDGDDDVVPLLHKYVSPDTEIQPVLLQLPSAYNYASAIMEHEGVALVACAGDVEGATANCAIFSYDGTTFDNVLTSIKLVRGFAKYRDSLIAFSDSGAYIRSKSGTWTGPFTVITPFGQDVCASYRDKLYIPDGTDTFKTYTAAGGFSSVLPATSGTTGGNIRAACVFNGYLYFAWLDSGANVYIGRFDGTTWDATHVDMSTMPGVNFYPTDAVGLKQYRGSLWLAANRDNATPGLFASPNINTSGTWLDSTPSSGFGGPAGRPIHDLLVF